MSAGRETPPATRRSAAESAALFAKGLCMGAADVVPGVSGGTMAFILGIYEELVDSIRAVARAPFLKALLGFRIPDALAAINAPFLVVVGAGILTAVVTLARVIAWLLEHHAVLLWSFFFGLVLASVHVVSQRIARWSPALLAGLAIGGLGAFVLVGLVPVQTPDAPWFLFVSGAIAICAMILPGISGSFLLVLLGKYEHILGALNQRDLVTLFWFCLGIGVGIVSFAQVLGWLFRRYHDATVAVLTGLMLGSLRKVWPWKVDLATMLNSHGKVVPTVQENVLPAWTLDGTFNLQIAAALGLAALGFVVVIVIERWAAGASEPERA